jgi:hypothetical protein
LARKPVDRSMDSRVEQTAYNLRVAGVSERAIYESFRSVLKEPPSYRDLRASFVRNGVATRAAATEARHSGLFVGRLDRQGRKQMATEYADRLRTTKEIDRRAEAKDDLDRNYVLGYMGRAGVDPDLIDDEFFADSLYSIEEGEGSR